MCMNSYAQDSTLKTIDSQLSRVEAIALTSRREFLTSRHHKDDMEWWILGKSVILLRQAGGEFPTFAIKQLPPQADFLTLDRTSRPLCYIEITEVLRRGRRRGDEYLTTKGRANNSNHEPSDPWQQIRMAIERKIKITYGDITWLLIYHNANHNRSLLWHEAILSQNHLHQWLQASIHLIPFKRILTMNPDANALVELHPQFTVIVPEPMFPQTFSEDVGAKRKK